MVSDINLVMANISDITPLRVSDKVFAEISIQHDLSKIDLTRFTFS